MLNEKKMIKEAHQRRKKTSTTMVIEDDEDDVDPMAHCTKGEIN